MFIANVSQGETYESVAQSGKFEIFGSEAEGYFSYREKDEANFDVPFVFIPGAGAHEDKDRLKTNFGKYRPGVIAKARKNPGRFVSVIDYNNAGNDETAVRQIAQSAKNTSLMRSDEKILQTQKFQMPNS